MTYDVHIGSLGPDVIVKSLSSFPLVLAVFSDGDSWHKWGELAAADEAKHVVARVETVGKAIDFARYLVELNTPEATILQPMEGIPNHYEPGALVVVSDTDDWAEQYLTAYSDRAILKRRVLR